MAIKIFSFKLKPVADTYLTESAPDTEAGKFGVMIVDIEPNMDRAIMMFKIPEEEEEFTDIDDNEKTFPKNFKAWTHIKLRLWLAPLVTDPMVRDLGFHKILDKIKEGFCTSGACYKSGATWNKKDGVNAWTKSSLTGNDTGGSFDIYLCKPMGTGWTEGEHIITFQLDWVAYDDIKPGSVIILGIKYDDESTSGSDLHISFYTKDCPYPTKEPYLEIKGSYIAEPPEKPSATSDLLINAPDEDDKSNVKLSWGESKTQLPTVSQGTYVVVRSEASGICEDWIKAGTNNTTILARITDPARREFIDDTVVENKTYYYAVYYCDTDNYIKDPASGGFEGSPTKSNETWMIRPDLTGSVTAGPKDIGEVITSSLTGSNSNQPSGESIGNKRYYTLWDTDTDEWEELETPSDSHSMTHIYNSHGSKTVKGRCENTLGYWSDKVELTNSPLTINDTTPKVNIIVTPKKCVVDETIRISGARAQPASAGATITTFKSKIWRKLEDVLEARNNPPPSPPVGARYLILGVPTGDWVGHGNEIAEWNGTSWDFYVPIGNDSTDLAVVDGEIVWNLDLPDWYCYDGPSSGWTAAKSEPDYTTHSPADDPIRDVTLDRVGHEEGAHNDPPVNEYDIKMQIVTDTTKQKTESTTMTCVSGDPVELKLSRGSKISMRSEDRRRFKAFLKKQGGEGEFVIDSGSKQPTIQLSGNSYKDYVHADLKILRDHINADTYLRIKVTDEQGVTITMDGYIMDLRIRKSYKRIASWSIPFLIVNWSEA